MDYASTLVGNSISLEWKRHSYSDTETWSAVGESFRIDDLLNFSNDDIAGPIGYDEENNSDSCLTESCESLETNYSLQFQLTEEPPASELCVPSDALAELEWLSNFVEEPLIIAEDVTELGSCCNVVPSVDEGTKENRSARDPERDGPCKFEILIPGRARSKRSRTGGRVWSFNPPLPDPSFESRGSVFTPLSDTSSACSRPAKRANHGKKNHDGSQTRRCSHCLSQKTPQWRAGPLGPKTLCNACGVRFKSGRLLPEYRPFGSPTFSSDIHSNSHRKVLEIRRQKEHPSVLCEGNSTTEDVSDKQA